jgi:hypothetical protein
MKKTILAILTALPFVVPESGIAQPAAEPETVESRAAPMTDAVVTSFVKTFASPSPLTDKIPRWSKPICLKTEGLPRERAEAVTKRVLDVARMAGAPVQDQPCALNTVVIFDPDPQGLLDDLAVNQPELLGPHDPAQTKELAKVRFPVQAWYATETQDDRGAIVADNKNQSEECGTADMTTVVADSGSMKGGGFRGSNALLQDVVQNVQRTCGRRVVAGSRVRDGVASHLSTVTVVASMDVVKTHDVGAVADYLALVILSQTKAFETCEKMETIANMLVPRCDLDNRITGLMPGDIAFLKALYKADSGGTLVAQQAAIAGEMKKLLNNGP